VRTIFLPAYKATRVLISPEIKKIKSQNPMRKEEARPINAWLQKNETNLTLHMVDNTVAEKVKL
jgi:hypothetical protein